MAAMLSPDRQRGTLHGLAIGDALGAAAAFKSPGIRAGLSKADGLEEPARSMNPADWVSEPRPDRKTGYPPSLSLG
jgi:ADP-ribosylglycohydrolase